MASENEIVTPSELFEVELPLPDEQLARQAQRLVGFDERYRRLLGDLRLLLDREGVVAWSERLYGKCVPLVEIIGERYPLVIFHGDVGTGKTVTAEATANTITQELGKEGMLFKLSTRVRGTGRVGQMSALINQAFSIVTKEAGKTRLAFLILDEADSLAASRDTDQSHHEDKAAVNTLIQKIDDVRRFSGRVLIFLCTNRYWALDPAILRRAGRIERFDRPGDREREQLFRMDCEGLEFTDAALRMFVRLTGPDGDRPYGYTYSDIRTRLLPDAVGRAYPDRALLAEDLVEAAKGIDPSPPTAAGDSNEI